MRPAAATRNSAHTAAASTVGWKIAAPNPSLASVRYRALAPILSLQREGIAHRLIVGPNTTLLEGLSALVIVKSFTPADVYLAEQAASRGIPVVFDLCDNIFIDAYRGRAGFSPGAVLRTMLPFLSMIVVTTEPLAQAVRAALGSRVPIRVIPDGLEFEGLAEQGAALVRRAMPATLGQLLNAATGYARASARRLRKARGLRPGTLIASGRRWIARELSVSRQRERLYKFLGAISARPRGTGLSPPATPAGKPATRRQRLVWFGNHGAEHAQFGMLDLLDIQGDLERVAREHPIELWVISNHRKKFDAHIAPFALPTHYVEWSSSAVEEALRGAAMVLVPNSLDAFSLCKSANRTVLALSRGVPVVATATPALHELSACIESEGFEAGIRRYLEHPAQAAAHVALARERLDRLYGPKAIAAAWRDALASLHSARGTAPALEPEWVIVMHLIQDLDLAVPLIEAAQKRNIRIEVWPSLSLLEKSPRVAAALARLDVRVRPVPEDKAALRGRHWPASLRVLITLAETNLGPHRISRQLCEMANGLGVFTATMQHGFENVGLNYEDEIHTLQSINFASKRIYLWGPLESLHPEVAPDVRERCVPIGCPKPATVPMASLDGVLPAGQPVVGVFENLHWHRYDADYKAFFLNGVSRLAQAFPEVVFLVKPHHAGMWLTRRHDSPLALPDNVLIADPRHRDWEAYTTPSLLGRLAGVITTPSTVALDAARHGVPVAMVQGGLVLGAYAPLFMIRAESDWLDALSTMLRSPEFFNPLAEAFLSRVLVQKASAAHAIIEDLMAVAPANSLERARAAVPTLAG